MKKPNNNSENNFRSDLERFNFEILASSALQERLKAATNPDSLIDLVVELGQEKGYSFTQEEVKAALEMETSFGKDYHEYAMPLKSGAVVAGCACGANGDDSSTLPCADDPAPPGDDFCLLCHGPLDDSSDAY